MPRPSQQRIVNCCFVFFFEPRGPVVFLLEPIYRASLPPGSPVASQTRKLVKEPNLAKLGTGT